MKNIFDINDSKEMIERINNLTAGTQGQWGKMNVSQMVAHCNVSFEMAYENKHPKPGRIKKFFMNLLIKNAVVNETPYKKNTPTAPVFKIVDSRDFELEKTRLINYIKKTTELGTSYFEGRESHSFGPLNANQWNNMFTKHLDHHLRQFGV